MYIEINEKNPDSRQINKVVSMLCDGAVIIYPTDSVYAIGCDPENKKGVEKLYNIKNADPKIRPMTFMCDSIAMAATYAEPISNANFRFIKEYTPGPITFIMNANNNLPRIIGVKNKSFGFRIPDNKICQAIISALGRPILSSSLKALNPEDEIGYYIEPERINSDYALLADLIISGGTGQIETSTIIDLTQDNPEIIRDGRGVVETE